MTDFLNSLKADLLDRRVLPIVALVCVALVAGVGYAVLGGGSSTPPTAVATPTALLPTGIAVTQSPKNPDQPVAETTSGVSHQRGGNSRNPFAPLVVPVKRIAAAPPATTGSSLTTSTGSGSSTPSSGTSSGGSGESTPSAPTTPSKPSTPTKPAKPTTVYHVAVLFGEIPAGALPENAQLTPYENLKLLIPLPSAKQPLVVFRGVTTAGKSATFTLVGEAILHGSAACLPSSSQCQAIDLKPGQSEQLEYLTPSGGVLTYELRVVSIVASTASIARAKSVLHGESKAGREALRHAGLLTIPDLHYSSQVGVLVFAAHPARGARARMAARHRRTKR
jgi:hypothetical protein